MDIMKLGAQLLAAKLGNNANSDMVQSAIGSLLGNDSGNGIDLGNLVSGLQGGGLGNIVESWLGDGDNEEISEQQVEGIFGADKIQEMASQLGADQSEVLAGLKDALPQMVDKSSSAGSLLDSVGGISGLAGLASKFLK
ncbi:MAG: YidB family protein [Arenicella sp.]